MFAERVRACGACGGAKMIVHAYVDRAQAIMLGEANDDGRWAHDGEGFIDGVWRIACAACGVAAYESGDCTRCHAAGALEDVRKADSRMTPPKKCPKCSGLEMAVVGFAPSRTEVVAGRPGKPKAEALLGEPGFHVVAVGCDDCDWAQVAEGCPMCGAPSPIRKRPG